MIADGRGLYLRTTISGAKGWIFRYQIAGQRHDMGLGSIDDISLAEARDEIHELHRLIRQGVDPIDARRSKRAMSEKAAGRTVTFQKFADEFVSLRQVEWRNAKHAEQWTKTLSDYVYPVCGSWPIDTIDTPTVLRVLTPLWTKIPETASRLRGRIEAILDGAKTAGHRQGENPARWKGHLANLLPRKAKVRRVEHHAALPYTEIGSFMVELRQKVGTAARALEFTILTIGRTGEVLKARWNEIDLDEGLWTIPADRMKAGREHRVPLSARAAEILEEMREIA
jgi:integrase